MRIIDWSSDVCSSDLLDAEDEAGQRRVEGGGEAGRGAGQHEALVLAEAALAQRMHDRGADLHGGALAADRGADAEREDGQQDLADGDTQRQQAAAVVFIREMAGGDRLRNAAALRILEIAPGDPEGERQSGRRNNQRRVWGDARSEEHTSELQS